MDIKEIQRILPHRYPFLLVDRIIEIDLGKKIVGIKNVSVNEPFFQGHFPGYPVMPGVLIIEAMAQVGGVLAFKSVEEKMDISGKLVYFAGIDKAKFRKPVFPGDQIRFELEVIHVKEPYWKLKGLALVDGKKVCEAELMALVGDKER
ncbi:MAG: 3-hydroxyacyl-ACP dehydratase FabZ [Nitrospirae bacterium]|nr:3-hydroxyacyl-ACP dehydratase FabZ [Nitrospirota bacterium]MBI5096268.1 3-hydroxyacyl-ACP dehydratase FabZ [Nitrospirota bacterium]